MIASKRIAAITVVVVCIALLSCGLIVYGANAWERDNSPEYAKKLFGDEIISLNIEVSDADWQSLLDNAQSKEWISAAVVINGERFSMVGIRTKGNSSLSMGGMGGSSGTERYSLQFKFNKYVKGQTYYGLDSFCVNNMMGDATYMKDYISYDIMSYIGVDTPLTNYASVTVNGEAYGFGIALERYDEAFLDRVYSTSAGELYSVKISMGQRGDFEDRWQDVENTLPGRQQGGNAFDFSQAGGMGGMGGMGGFGAGGGSLVYNGDDPANYSAIFDNAVIGTVSDKDKERVITAIENLNAGTELETYFDVDATLRYFAAHTVVVNLDSYISNMQQNYYIYERDGKLTVLPWDYGLAFGGYMSGTASSVVNFPIDTPVSGVNMEDRPLLSKLLEVDEYRERYHEYLRQIAEGYFESGLFEETVNNLNAKIGEYVKNDVSAYFTYEQYAAALTEFIKLGYLRAESILGQLDGMIPSTSAGQSADISALIDASDVNISALGSMMGGGMGQGGRGGGEGGDQNGGFGMFGGDTPDMELMQQAMQIFMEAGGELTDEVKAALLDIGITEEQMEMFSGMLGRFQGGNMDQGGGFPGMGRQNAAPGEVGAGGGQGGGPDNANSPQGAIGLNDPGASSDGTLSGTETAIAIGVLLLLLAGAIVFIARPRKNVI